MGGGPVACAGGAPAAGDEGGSDMDAKRKGADGRRFRVQDLGLTERDAALLLDALGGGGEAADLGVAAAEMSPGVLAATVLFAVARATGGLRPGAAGATAEYRALAARLAAMDPRDAFRVEGWVAGFLDAAGADRAAQAARSLGPAERPAGATVH
jgi:hypothetical protein